MFGLLIWEMLHGKIVWSQYNTAELIKRVLAGELPEIDQRIREKVPSQLIEVIVKCLAFDPL